MQLAYEQLKSHLQNKLAPIYWLSGDEPFLQQEARTSIRAKALQKGFTEQLTISVDTKFNWQDFQQELFSPSLFSTQRLFDLRLTQSKIDVQSSKILVQLCTSLPADTVLLISSPKLDSTTAKSTWYQTIAKMAICIAIWPLDKQQLLHWLQQRCQQANLQLLPPALELLTQWVEGNLLAAAQAISKLELLYSHQVIGVDEISTLIEDEARFDIFKLVDSALQGESLRAQRALNNLKTEGIEPPLILWAITRELRSLAQMAESLAEGVSIDRLLQEQRLLPRRKSIIRHCLQNHTQKNWYSFIQQAAAIDRIIKGVEPGDSWEALSGLLLAIAQPVIEQAN